LRKVGAKNTYKLTVWEKSNDDGPQIEVIISLTLHVRSSPNVHE